jgi:hypothetical protein
MTDITMSIGRAEGRGSLFGEGLRQVTGILYRDKISSNFSVNDNRYASKCRSAPRFALSYPLAGLFFSRMKDLKKVNNNRQNRKYVLDAGGRGIFWLKFLT